MKVKIAAQVLSNTVAAGIQALAKGKIMTEESNDTALFIHFFDSLFDTFNGSTKFPSDGKKLKCWLSSSSPHMNFCNSAISVVNSLEFMVKDSNRVSRPPCQKGWVNNRAIGMLWRKLHADGQGIEFINLRNINQDPQENFFSVIRQNGGANDNPNCIQFVAALKTAVINSLSSVPSSAKNCEEDDGFLLSDLRDLMKGSKNVPVTPSTSSSTSNPSLFTTNLEDSSIPDFTLHFKEQDISSAANQPLTYLAGCIVRKIVPPDFCPECQNCLHNSEVTPAHLFTSLKEFDSQKRLTYASEAAVKFVGKTMQAMLRRSWTVFHSDNLKENLVSTAFDAVGQHEFVGCPNHRQQVSTSLINFIARVVIFTKCKRHNRTLSKKYSDMSNRKKVQIFKHQ